MLLAGLFLIPNDSEGSGNGFLLTTGGYTFCSRVLNRMDTFWRRLVFRNKSHTLAGLPGEGLDEEELEERTRMILEDLTFEL